MSRQSGSFALELQKKGGALPPRRGTGWTVSVDGGVVSGDPSAGGFRAANYRLETDDGPIKYVCPFDQEQHLFFGSSPLTILVPRDGSRLQQIRSDDDARAEAQLRAIHTKTSVSVAWFLDGEKIATTHDSHEVTTRVSPGSHHLLIVDDRGYSDNASFSVTKAE